MGEDIKRQNIIDAMKPMIAEAREKGLWLFCHYQRMWLAPAELEAAHAQGQFVWGPPNWELRHPSEEVEHMEAGIRAAIKARDDFKQRMLKNV